MNKKPVHKDINQIAKSIVDIATGQTNTLQSNVVKSTEKKPLKKSKKA